MRLNMTLQHIEMIARTAFGSLGTFWPLFGIRESQKDRKADFHIARNPEKGIPL
jgi:hypothetical protein